LAECYGQGAVEVEATRAAALELQQTANRPGTFKANLIAWLGDAQNRIGDLFANNFNGHFV
jgi:hypothetical protein